MMRVYYEIGKRGLPDHNYDPYQKRFAKKLWIDRYMFLLDSEHNVLVMIRKGSMDFETRFRIHLPPPSKKPLLSTNGQKRFLVFIDAV